MPTSLKMDRGMILRYLGNTQEAIRFADSIERILFLDEQFLSFLQDGYAIDTTPQHEFLNEILESCNQLLTILQPLKQSKSQYQYCEDYPTAKVIQSSLWLINRKNRIEQDAHHYDIVGINSFSLSDAITELLETCKRTTDINKPQHDKNISNELDTYERIPGDYPNAVIESVEKLRDAVVHAADRTKPKSGRDEYKTGSFIRKDKLGCKFVQNYLINFGRLPPKSNDNPVYNVFVEFLYAANLPGIGEEHCYKKSINKVENDIKEERALYKPKSVDQK